MRMKLMLLICVIGLGACSAAVDGAPPVAPAAANVLYAWIGNVDLMAPVAAGIVARVGGSFSVVPQTALGTSSGGLVTVQADGAFTYSAPHLFTGTDTFVYARADSGSTATVTIAMPTRAWFVNANAAGGDGTINEPFNNFAAAQAASLAGDTIMVRTTVSAVPDTLVLKAAQRLLGEGVAFVQDGITILPATTPSFIAPSSGTAVTAAPGCSIEGVAFSSGPTIAVAINLAAPGGSVSISDVSVTGAFIGIQVNVGASTTLQLELNSCFFTTNEIAVSVASSGNLTAQCTSVSCIGNFGTDFDFNGADNSNNALTFATCTLFNTGAGAFIAALTDMSETTINFTGCSFAGEALPDLTMFNASDSAQLTLLLQDCTMDALANKGVQALAHCEAAQNASVALLATGCILTAPTSMGLLLNSRDDSTLSSYVGSCTFAAIDIGVKGTSQAGWTSNINSCMFVQPTNAAMLIRQSGGQHGLVLQGCVITQASGNAVTSIGPGSSLLLALLDCSITGGTGPVFAVNDASTTTSTILVRDCTFTDNGPLTAQYLHTGGGSACADFSGNTHGITNGTPSVVVFLNGGAAGPMSLANGGLPNVALTGATFTVLGSVTSVGSCGL
ncbi:MAG: hypothetical protein EXS14_09765 [Planctomycetes bacterium]|nr:hypothetical protein [Planctomycetota bacterium]